MNGYVICKTGDDALTAFDDPTVRYAASLDDGSGFLAFEGDGADAHRLASLGRVLVASEQDPEWFPFLIPKRRIATGTECFYLSGPVDYWLAWDEARYYAEDGVTGIAVVVGNSINGDGDHRILVETDGPRHWFGLEWFAVSVECRDSRLAVSA